MSLHEKTITLNAMLKILHDTTLEELIGKRATQILDGRYQGNGWEQIRIDNQLTTIEQAKAINTGTLKTIQKLIQK